MEKNKFKIDIPSEQENKIRFKLFEAYSKFPFIEKLTLRQREMMGFLANTKSITFNQNTFYKHKPDFYEAINKLMKYGLVKVNTKKLFVHKIYSITSRGLDLVSTLKDPILYKNIFHFKWYVKSEKDLGLFGLKNIK